VTLLKSKS